MWNVFLFRILNQDKYVYSTNGTFLISKMIYFVFFSPSRSWKLLNDGLFQKSLRLDSVATIGCFSFEHKHFLSFFSYVNPVKI